MALVPLGDRILVKRIEEDEQEGVVIAVGKGRLLDNGERQAVDVAAGDNILFGKYGGTEATHDNLEYLILREDDILAKIT